MAAANNRAIELLFGVAGGASIASGSGKNIADAMRQIVSQIEQSGVTSLDFTASDASLQKLRESIRKAVTDIKVTVDGSDIGSTRAPGTAGASAGAEDLDTRAQEIRRLTDLYKQYYDFQIKSASHRNHRGRDTVCQHLHSHYVYTKRSGSIRVGANRLKIISHFTVLDIG